MPVDAARVRELALAMPAACEAPHFHRLAFRTPRKTFATLDATAHDLNLMFDPDTRDFFCEQAPHAFAPVAGGWGRMGITRCDLQEVDEATMMSALLAAHKLAAPKEKRPKSGRLPKRSTPVALGEVPATHASRPKPDAQ